MTEEIKNHPNQAVKINIRKEQVPHTSRFCLLKETQIENILENN